MSAQNKPECEIYKKKSQNVNFLKNNIVGLSVQCTLRNESPHFALCASFLRQKDSLKSGDSNFKVRFFLRTKVRENTKRNNLLMSGGTQQSQSWWRCLSCAFYFDRSSFCCVY